MFLNIFWISLNCIIIGTRCHETGHSSDFFDTNIEHIKEEVKEVYHIELDSKTSEKELDWYYFQMHDFDHNLVLDGLEILTAMNHAIDENTLKSKESEQATTKTPHDQSNDEEREDPMELFNMRQRYKSQVLWNEKFEEDSKTIDKLLKDYDRDNNGFISYTEYIIARRDIVK